MSQFPDPSSCLAFSDALSCSCEPRPASCLERFAIESSGTTIAAGSFAELGTLQHSGIASIDGAEFVVAGCGGEARVSFAAAAAPTVIVSIDTSDGLQVNWLADPPASEALLAVGQGGGVVCRDSTGSLELDRDRFVDGVPMIVQALLDPVEQETELGIVRVWIAGQVIAVIGE
jgi:hypothetical protein